jgi:hypothetical protein
MVAMSSLSEQTSAAVASHAAFAIEGNKIIDRIMQIEKKRIKWTGLDFCVFPSLLFIKLHRR